MRGPLILHRMVEREFVVESPAEDSEGQQHCKCQGWIRVPSFAVEGQQEGAPTNLNSASTKTCKAAPMYFVGFIPRPVICLEAPDSSLLTTLIRGKLCSRLSGSPGVARMERFRGCTHQNSDGDVAGRRLPEPENVGERPLLDSLRQPAEYGSQLLKQKRIDPESDLKPASPPSGESLAESWWRTAFQIGAM